MRQIKPDPDACKAVQDLVVAMSKYYPNSEATEDGSFEGECEGEFEKGFEGGFEGMFEADFADTCERLGLGELRVLAKADMLCRKNFKSEGAESGSSTSGASEEFQSEETEDNVEFSGWAQPTELVNAVNSILGDLLRAKISATKYSVCETCGM